MGGCLATVDFGELSRAEVEHVARNAFASDAKGVGSFLRRLQKEVPTIFRPASGPRTRRFVSYTSQ